MAQPSRQSKEDLTLEQVREIFKETRLVLPGERDPYFESLRAIERAGQDNPERYGGRILAAFDGDIIYCGDDFWEVLDWVEASSYPIGETAIKLAPGGPRR